jgi:hypothetical protein
MRPLLILALLGLSACSLLERNPRSGYAYDDGYASDRDQRPPTLYEERRANQEADVREELGYNNGPLTAEERVAVETRMRLKKAEARLSTKREKRQYYGLRSSFKNDGERLYFLSLPTVEARERWANARGLGSQDEKRTDAVAEAIEANDIALGMSEKSVLQSWGDPDAVEVAGNPIYGHERWKYNRYVSGDDGYKKELRVVYFEGGRVVGWERP